MALSQTRITLLVCTKVLQTCKHLQTCNIAVNTNQKVLRFTTANKTAAKIRFFAVCAVSKTRKPS